MKEQWSKLNIHVKALLSSVGVFVLITGFVLALLHVPIVLLVAGLAGCMYLIYLLFIEYYSNR